ncbi:MAG: pyridoxamine 5'-phosphate oxidase family protein [Tannerella sp.]|jgi:uncharacterized pyridoxamine 5'-phosphate oxidase family protein|nr:pyridoxamine 5'-phosphate oxidase family protein [Tannerella sp.]
MEEVYDFLKKSETYFLATVDGDRSRVRPFGTADIFENRLYIQTGRVKSVYRQMKANPKIEICAMANGKWMRVEAVAVEDDRLEARQHMLDAWPSLKSMYAADDGNSTVFYLKDAMATVYSFTEDPREITF